MTTHTPGPWNIEGSYNNKGEAAIAATTHIIGYVTMGSVNNGSSSGQANARLICAAPDLLAACQVALTYLQANRPKGNIRDHFTENPKRRQSNL